MHSEIPGLCRDLSSLHASHPSTTPQMSPAGRVAVGLRSSNDRMKVALCKGSVEQAGIFPFLQKFLVIHPT